MRLEPTLHGQHMAIFQEKLYHGIQRVNVVVTREDKSTLNIAHDLYFTVTNTFC